ncbi:alpha/beta hydrolase [Fulvivirga lutimaris]|uniref:alpha/beta hydrolase n=1 Tax=Fulvivirga lutimaris TaxID=1819566 RepID=UPI0012BD6C33|nr:carboxylesterase family protein [Fulvivirga lutimaris]MTI40923.1 alpha/beta hydrolase [Fulvivirga lutimaris]
MKFMLALLSFIIISANNLLAQDFKTLTYLDNDDYKLELDLFLPKGELNGKVPLMVYVHGGGFAGGERTESHKLAAYLNKRNIAVASISYTLYMKDKSFSCDGITSEKVKAIQIAGNQVWAATAYLLANKEQYGFDENNVFLTGSSAGAETVLHAAYWDRKVMRLFDHKLSPDFKYKGIISAAGAIMDLNLISKENNIPTMVYHGDKDKLVPYANAAHHYCEPNATGWLMLFGSHSIAEQMRKIGGSYHLTTFTGGGHEHYATYIYNNHEPIYNFINMVLSGTTFNIHKTEKSK